MPLAMMVSTHLADHARSASARRMRTNVVNWSYAVTPSNQLPRDPRTNHESLLTTPARALLQLGLAPLRPLTLVEVATCRALQRLVLTAPAGRRRPTALPLLPLTHGFSPPSSVPLVVGDPASGRWPTRRRAYGRRSWALRVRAGRYGGALDPVDVTLLWWRVVGVWVGCGDQRSRRRSRGL